MITIAIDGFSSTGKSTIAKELARTLGYVYVDSGAMYRAITLYALEQGFAGDGFFDSEGLFNSLSKIKIEFRADQDGNPLTYLNDRNVESLIRSMEVSAHVSTIAARSEVRKFLVAIQKEFGKNKGVVMDGRDIGTVVFPDAELKLFMTASAETRAKRRFEELKEKGQTVSYEDVLANVIKRDHLDTTREDSPLIKAADAIEIDNSELNREEQMALVLNLVEKTLQD